MQGGNPFMPKVASRQSQQTNTIGNTTYPLNNNPFSSSNRIYFNNILANNMNTNTNLTTGNQFTQASNLNGSSRLNGYNTITGINTNNNQVNQPSIKNFFLPNNNNNLNQNSSGGIRSTNIQNMTSGNPGLINNTSNPFNLNKNTNTNQTSFTTNTTTNSYGGGKII